MVLNISPRADTLAFEVAKTDMSRLTISRAEFWDEVPALVTSKIQLAQDRDAETRRPVIEFLRNLETVARAECNSRETVQVIASGRRLLGDMTQIASGTGPFSRT